MEIPTRKHHMRQLEGNKAGLGVISWDIRLQGKQNSNNLWERQRPIVLPALLAPSTLWLLLPRETSSFFTGYFSIHFFPFPKFPFTSQWIPFTSFHFHFHSFLRMRSGSINKITKLRFPNTKQTLPEPIWQCPGWEDPFGNSSWHQRGAGDGQTQQQQGRPSILSPLETEGIKSLYKTLCRKSYFHLFS